MSNFQMNNVAMTGAQVRSAKRENRTEGLTRAQACRAIAGTADPKVIEKFAKHGSKQVRRYSAHKLAMLLTAPTIPSPAPVEVSGGVDLSRFNLRTWTKETAVEAFRVMAEAGLSQEEFAELAGVKVRRVKDWAKKVA